MESGNPPASPESKWLTAVSMAVQGELDRVSQTLTGRIRELSERYERPLPDLIDEVESLSNKVNAHLVKMGFDVPANGHGVQLQLFKKVGA